MVVKRGIDHLVLCVRDLEAARRFYGRLGFTTTPPAVHPFGTGNSLVQLQGNFLELLSVVEPDRVPAMAPGEFSFGAFNRDFLARRQGMSMLVFQSDDARRDQREFAGKGLTTYAPFDFSRKAMLPDGSTVTVGFSLAFVTDPRMPAAAFFVCQQHAPEYFWKPEYQRHPNGARAVTEVIMTAEAPATFAELFEGLQGPQSVSVGEGALRVATAKWGAAWPIAQLAFGPRQAELKARLARLDQLSGGMSFSARPGQASPPELAALLDELISLRRETVADEDPLSAMVARLLLAWARFQWVSGLFSVAGGQYSVVSGQLSEDQIVGIDQFLAAHAVSGENEDARGGGDVRQRGPERHAL